jgi:RNA-splicing ligase RtcB
MQMKKQGYAPYEMTCLSGELMEEYIYDIKIIQEFAKLNREAIIDSITNGMKWKIEASFTCIHNYVDFSGVDGSSDSDAKPILRKGAISAKEGERVIIPINMRDGIILGTGLGNAEWNYSAPHGAGRIYKRSEVAEHHTLSEFKKAMKGIYSICINKDTLDESPFAYRGIDDIAEVIRDTVKIDKIIKPVYNYKA